MNLNRKEYLLATLAEEAGEITQAAMKALRFGLHNHHPERPFKTNENEIFEEFYQLVAVLEMMRDEGYISEPRTSVIQSIKAEKKSKLKDYIERKDEIYV